MKSTPFFALILWAGVAFAVPQPYPITIDSQSRTAPALEMNQGEPYTVRVTFKSGTNTENVSMAIPFMWWAVSAQATNYVTSSWSRVNSGTGGVVDFTFSAAALNTNGDLAYGVGANQTFRQGALRIRANPWAVGVASPNFSLSTNLAGVSFINYPWIDSASVTDGNSNHVAVLGNALQFTVRTNFGTSDAEAVDLSALSNGVARAVTNAGSRVNGYPITNGAALLVGTVREIMATGGLSVSQADGPIAIVSGINMATNAAGSGRLTLAISGQTITGSVDFTGIATGAPIYEVSGLGTDTTARAWAVGASNRADAAYVIAAAAATGTPLYAESFTGSVGSVAGLATGTPVYAEADPVFVAASNALLTKVQAASLYATGTPLYVENNPSLVAVSGSVANAQTVGSNALAVANAASNLAQRAIPNSRLTSDAILSSTGNTTRVLDVYSGYTVFIWDSDWGTNVTNFPKAGLDNGDKIFIPTSAGGWVTVTLSGGNWNKSYALSGNYYDRMHIYLEHLGSRTAVTGTLAAVSTEAHTVLNERTMRTLMYVSSYHDGRILLSESSISSLNVRVSASTNLSMAIGAGATNGIISVGLTATNAQITASNAATTASAATNLALAIGAGATNGLLAIGLVATNAQVTASNAQTAVNGLGVVVSNQNPGAWNQTATGTVAMATNRISQLAALSFANNANVGDIDYGIVFTNGFPVYAQGTGRYSIYGTWNFSPSSYQTAAAQASYATNALKLFAGAVTQNQVTARNQVYFDSTNLWIGLGGTNSIRFGGVLNAY